MEGESRCDVGVGEVNFVVNGDGDLSSGVYGALILFCVRDDVKSFGVGGEVESFGFFGGEISFGAVGELELFGFGREGTLFCFGRE